MVLKLKRVRVADFQSWRVLHFDLDDRDVFALADGCAEFLDLERKHLAVRQDDRVDMLEVREIRAIGDVLDDVASLDRLVRIEPGLLRDAPHELFEEDLLALVLAVVRELRDVGVREDVAIRVDDRSGAAADVLCLLGAPIRESPRADVAVIDSDHGGLREVRQPLPVGDLGLLGANRREDRNDRNDEGERNGIQGKALSHVEGHSSQIYVKSTSFEWLYFELVRG